MEQEMWKFAGEMAHRLQGLRTQLELRQIRSAPQRVLQSLHLRCDATGRWAPEGTLKQFAEEIGLTHEALYRALATQKKEGRHHACCGQLAESGIKTAGFAYCDECGDGDVERRCRFCPWASAVPVCKTGHLDTWI